MESRSVLHLRAITVILGALILQHSALAQDFPAIDGSNNNRFFPDRNAANTQLGRAMLPDYSDLVSQMAGVNRPGPRDISNAVVAQNTSVPNSKGLTDFFWQWGQFLDHDIDLTETANPEEFAVIPVPLGDPWFDPAFTGTATIGFSRSAHDPQSGTAPENAREQMNFITGWIDASNVYGSDSVRANAIRTLDGTGKLKVSSGDLLPFNDAGLPNAGGTSPMLFLAGDIRANEQVALTALHTVFVREHNRLAEELAAQYPTLSPDGIYNEARVMVAGLVQAITYEEFVPALLGSESELNPYRRYKRFIDARIVNLFSTAAFRFGHSMLSPQLKRTNADGTESPERHLELKDAFFAPDEITQNGIESILRGLTMQVCQELDPYVVDDVRNFLFGAPGAGGFDLASLNIQRGRDHGLPSYNGVRVAAGFSPAVDFSDISSDPNIQANLSSVYATPDDVDLWVGGLAEDPVGNAIVGPVFYAVLKEQFELLRDGDRFWYQRYLTPAHYELIGSMRLSDVIRRNTSIGGEIADNVFYVDP